MARRDWVDDHIRRYRETDGADGHIWGGRDGDQTLPCLLLTTTGHKSGEETTTALIYGKSGDACVVVASTGGAADHPTWYLNLAANPGVSVQVLGDKFSATARTATDEERQSLWAKMAEIFPTYNKYHETAKATREIPVVVLDRA
ncbi:MAG: nitroreductase family deazaflavin-dependent oxidoreductase [Alphaproteobacteria bacterium]|nr:nitroreductase family deazaflavin-dependent oxidoreductase [Alphaproteobacteria bacterium]